MSELDKLVEYLKGHGYKYKRIDEENNFYDELLGREYNRHQVLVFEGDLRHWSWDAICHYGSYGYDEGLLEVSGVITNDDVEGWLTANDIIARLEKANARK